MAAQCSSKSGRGWGDLAEAENDGHALQLTAGEVRNLLVNNRIERERLGHVRLKLWVHERVLDLLVQKHPHRALERWRDFLRPAE